MYLDAQQLYSDAQALTVTAVSTNVIDHGSDRDIGLGEPLAVVIVVDVALIGNDSNETYTAEIITDDNAAMSSPTAVTPAFSLPRLSAAGTKFILPVPPSTTMERYSAVRYTLGGTTPGGTVTAFLTKADMADTSGESVYRPDSITIS